MLVHSMRIPIKILMTTAMILFPVFSNAGKNAFAQGVIGNDQLSPDMVNVLNQADQVTIYALNAAETKSIPNYFGWQLLSHQAVFDLADRQQIGRLLAKQTSPKSVRYCQFSPHHGIALQSFGHKLDFVVCFHCSQILIYDNGQYWNHGCLSGSSDQLERRLNRILMSRSRVDH